MLKNKSVQNGGRQSPPGGVARELRPRSTESQGHPLQGLLSMAILNQHARGTVIRSAKKQKSRDVCPGNPFRAQGCRPAKRRFNKQGKTGEKSVFFRTEECCFLWFASRRNHRMHARKGDEPAEVPCRLCFVQVCLSRRSCCVAS